MKSLQATWRNYKDNPNLALMVFYVEWSVLLFFPLTAFQCSEVWTLSNIVRESFFKSIWYGDELAVHRNTMLLTEP